MARFRFPRPDRQSPRARAPRVGGTRRRSGACASLLGLLLLGGLLVGPSAGAAVGGTTVFGILADADLSVTAADTADPVVAGEQITYTISVANAGPAEASEVELTLTLDPGVAFGSATGDGWGCLEASGIVTCDRPALAVGTAPDVTLVVTAPDEGGAVSNQAAVGSSLADPNPADNGDVEATDVTDSADLSIVKGGPASVGAAEQVAYTLDVSNAGPSTADAVVVTDQLPAGAAFVSATGTDWACNEATGTVTCTRSQIPVGAAPTIDLIVTAPAEPASLTNQASVDATTDDPLPGNDQSSVNTDVTASADLSMDKRGPNTAVAGSRIRYTLRVSNAGPSSASDVVVTDTLPAQASYVSVTGVGWSCGHAAGTVTCTRASLAVGAAPGIVVRIDTPGAQGPITNTASVGAATDDPVAGNDSDSKDTDLTGSADLSLDKAGPASIVAGNQIQYTLTVTNAGPSTATSLVVTDDLPAQTSFVSASGTGWACGHSAGTVTCTRPALDAGSAPAITLRITAAQTLSSIVNTAEVSSAVADPVPGNDDDTVTTTQTRRADLSIGPASATPDPGRVGSPIAYHFELDNGGPTIAMSAELEIDLPAGTVFGSTATTTGSCIRSGATVTCDLGTLASGEAATVDVSVTPTTPGAKTASASIAHEGVDPDPSDDDASPQTTVLGQACTQIGSQGPDTLTGTAGANVICGLAGNDTIGGGDGNDLIYAGNGNDDVSGGAGGDSINGQGGDDVVAGDGGFDYARYEGATAGVTGSLATGNVTGGDGSDTLSGIEGFVGSRFADQLTGDAFDNIIEGGRGNDVLDGAGGRDGASYALASAGVTASLASGSSSGADNVDTLSGFEDLFGSPFGDVLTGDGGTNSIHGLGGNDSIGGGGGFDFARYSSAPSAVTVDLALGTASGGHGNDSLSGIEGIAGSPFADTLKGDGETNTLIGAGGADVLNGGGDRDFVSYSSAPGPVSVNLGTLRSSGADGNDTLVSIEGVFGSAFADTITGSGGDESLDGLAGADVIAAGAGNDDVWGSAGNDQAGGGSGFDYARFDDAPAGVDVSIRGEEASGGDGSDELVGFEGATGSSSGDTIVGSSADQSLYGRAGNDKIVGERGADHLFGEGGDDTLNGGDGSDELRGGAGNDAMNGGRGTDTCIQGPGSGPRKGCEKSRFAPAPVVRPPSDARPPAG